MKMRNYFAMLFLLSAAAVTHAWNTITFADGVKPVYGTAESGITTWNDAQDQYTIEISPPQDNHGGYENGNVGTSVRDNLYFQYIKVHGAYEISARITSLERSVTNCRDDCPYAGVMVRTGLEDNSYSFAYLLYPMAYSSSGTALRPGYAYRNYNKSILEFDPFTYDESPVPDFLRNISSYDVRIRVRRYYAYNKYITEGGLSVDGGVHWNNQPIKEAATGNDDLAYNDINTDIYVGLCIGPGISEYDVRQNGICLAYGSTPTQREDMIANFKKAKATFQNVTIKADGVSYYALYFSSNSNGTVTVSPPIVGQSRMPYIYPSTAIPMLTATPNAGFYFWRWNGNLINTTNPSLYTLTVPMSEDRDITADFNTAQNLTITVSEHGSVNVQEHGNVATATTQIFSGIETGSTITIAAIPDHGYTLSGWSGDLTGTTSPASIAMNGDKSITATFDVATYTLQASAVNGVIVALDPPGGTYNHGTVVTVTAKPNSGYFFSNWSGYSIHGGSGNITGTTNPITITMEDDIIITATCSVIPNPNYTETTNYNVDGSDNDVTSRTYTDGLSRNLQSQSLDNATDNAVVSGTEYDDAGRQIKNVKPFPYANNTSLSYIPGDLPDFANIYYANGFIGEKDSAYFSMRYWDDPLARIKATGAPGINFAATAHPVKKWYFGVTGDKTPVNGIDFFDDNGFIFYSFLNDNSLNADIPQALELATSTLTYEYFLTVSKNPNGNFTQELKDIFGRTVRTWAKAGNNPTVTVDTIVAHFSYDIFGNILTEAPPQTQNQTNAIATRYSYNTVGQLVSKTPTDASIITYDYDAEGRIIMKSDGKSYLRTISYTYDDLGRALTVSEWPYRGYSTTRTRNVYDLPEDARQFLANSAFTQTGVDLNSIIAGLYNTRSRVVASIAYDDNFSFRPSPLAPGTEAEKLINAESGYSGKTIDLFSYDDDGNVSCKYKSIPGLPLQVTNYKYDIYGKLLKETNVSGSTAIVTNYVYDENGRLFSIARDDKEFIRYSYNDLGQVITKEFKNRSGESNYIAFDYTIRDWVSIISRMSPAGQGFGEEIFYDDAHTGDPNDVLNQYNGNISGAFVSTWSYTNGQLYPYKQDLRYTYDGVNRVTRIENNGFGTVFDDEYDATFSYLNDGRFLRKQEGLGQKDWGDYVYNPNTNKLTGIASSGTKEGTNYIYDPNGNMVLDRSKRMSIEYDWQDMPVKFRFFNNIPAAITDWSGVQGLMSDRLVKLQSEVVMTYDALGKRVNKEKFDYTQCTVGDPTIDALIISDPNNSVSLFIEPDGSFKTCLALTKIGSPLPTADAIDGLEIINTANEIVFAIAPNALLTGTPTSTTGYVKSGLEIKYKGTNIAAIDDQGGYLEIAGQIPKKIPNSGVTYVDGSRVFVWDEATSSYQLSYADVGGEGVSRASGNFEFYLKDHLGSTRAVLAEDWQTQEETAYLAYGKEMPLMSLPAVEKARKKFIGKETDNEGAISANVDLAIAVTSIDYMSSASLTLAFYLSDGTTLNYPLNFIREPPFYVYGKALLNRYERLDQERIIDRITITGTFVDLFGTRSSFNYENVLSGLSESQRTIGMGNVIKLSLNNTATALNGKINQNDPNFKITIEECPSANGMSLIYFGARYYDPEVGYWVSAEQKKQFWSPYSYTGNMINPIVGADINGLEMLYVFFTKDIFNSAQQGMIKTLFSGVQTTLNNLKSNTALLTTNITREKILHAWQDKEGEYFQLAEHAGTLEMPAERGEGENVNSYPLITIGISGNDIDFQALSSQNMEFNKEMQYDFYGCSIEGQAELNAVKSVLGKNVDIHSGKKFTFEKESATIAFQKIKDQAIAVVNKLKLNPKKASEAIKKIEKDFKKFEWKFGLTPEKTKDNTPKIEEKKNPLIEDSRGNDR